PEVPHAPHPATEADPCRADRSPLERDGVAGPLPGGSTSDVQASGDAIAGRTSGGPAPAPTVAGMSRKRPSKQKRAARNRQQRAALEARKAAARREAAAQAQAGDGGGRGGRFSRRRAGGATPASTSRRPTPAEARALQPPGYRAALAAIFTAVVAIIMLTAVLTVPSDGSGNPYTAYALAADWVASAIDTAQDQPGLTAAELADAVDD